MWDILAVQCILMENQWLEIFSMQILPNSKKQRMPDWFGLNIFFFGKNTYAKIHINWYYGSLLQHKISMNIIDAKPWVGRQYPTFSSYLSSKLLLSDIWILTYLLLIFCIRKCILLAFVHRYHEKKILALDYKAFEVRKTLTGCPILIITSSVLLWSCYS